jgi:hypothetical protein
MDGRLISDKVASKNWLVVGNAVSQLAKGVYVSVERGAMDGHRAATVHVWKGLYQMHVSTDDRHSGA